MQFLNWFIKGLAMGAADVVPGVSGGTLAFILGIYSRLLAAISAINLHALRLFVTGQWRACWRHIDGTFLLVLFSGVIVSIFSLAALISWLLEHRPVPLWAFFNGLIIAALPMLLKSVKWSLWRSVLFAWGLLLALLIAMLNPATLQPANWMFFFAGALAICAMILPGISGSFILLLLGMYAPVLLAVRELQLTIILLFAAGCLVGLLSFSRLLNWLLKHYHDATLALLTGVVVGALYRLWPWQSAAGLYSPWGYAATFGQHDLLLASACFLLAILVMLGLLNLEKWLGSSANVNAAPHSSKE